MVLMGVGSRQLEDSQVLIVNRRENQNHQMCQLHLSLMNKMEPEVDSFGDPTEPLHEV